VDFVAEEEEGKERGFAVLFNAVVKRKKRRKR
jgi:hypothetical protein